MGLINLYHSSSLRQFAEQKSLKTLVIYGLVVRVIVLLYSIVHDSYIEHIKFTDIDYHVFTNASHAIWNGKSPYNDKEYRYPPFVGILFVPNVLINENFGKILLILADISCAYLHFKVNIHQGSNRANSKFHLILWLFNPVTIGISTRGSFEPIICLLVLNLVGLLNSSQFFIAGISYGFAVHLKLYPIIYALAIYGYLTQKKPYLKNQSRVMFWIDTLKPSSSHFKFFIGAGISFSLFSLASYVMYGQDFLEQSYLYHLRRKDLQHNFSVYFYIFRQLPDYQQVVGYIALVLQFIGVLYLSIQYLSYESNRRTKLRKLTFSLFIVTYLFVSLNKVCTSQYFVWYLVFLPLVLDSIKISRSLANTLIVTWFSFQGLWLLSAYLYEYQHLPVLSLVATASLMFLVSNFCTVIILCHRFNPAPKDESKDYQ